MKRRKKRSTGARKRAPKPSGSTPSAKAPSKSRFGRRYSPAERASILAAARSEKLTATKVRARFGVSALTFYRWRRESGSSSAATGTRSAARGTRNGRPAGLDAQVRSEIRNRVREMIPRILEEEVRAALKNVLGRNPR